MQLILSLFPGAGLLDRGFEAAGFCVVRGPDVLLGQSIEGFRVPASHFAGVIGGPPCQDFSRARRQPPAGHGVRMLREFIRIIEESQPDWWLMENVPGVPSLGVDGYDVQRFNLAAHECGVPQSRNRAFQFGSRDGVHLVLSRVSMSQPGPWAKTAMANDSRRGQRSRARLRELQGLPRAFRLPGLSPRAERRAIGNGVPVPMARMVAEAIRERHQLSHEKVCVCGCGRPVTAVARHGTATCRKRMERNRRGVTAGIVTAV